MDDASIWLILGPILAALFGAVVGGFIREWWVERFYRPKLYILGESIIQNIHYRIMVKNSGKRAEEKGHRVARRKVTFFLLSSIKWNHGSTIYLIIQRKEIRKVIS